MMVNMPSPTMLPAAQAGTPQKMLEDQLRGKLRAAWCAETAFDEATWSSDRPERGQCAVTALVVQDAVGGEIVRAMVHGESHYWNVLADGREIDLTRDQFDTWPDPEPEFVTRDYVLSHPSTLRRYRLLAARMGDVVPL